jgi:hypothetical protein
LKVIDEQSKVLIRNRIRIQICKSEVRSADPDPYQNVTDPEHCANLGSASKNLCTLTPKIVSKL